MKSLRIGTCIAILCSTKLFATTAGPFDFHSDFWLNLHHFLYEQAGKQHPPSADELSGADLETWNRALTTYRQTMVRHDLIFDTHMQAIDSELAEDETLPKLPLSGADAALWSLLNSVAPIYRAYWWKAHDQANHDWIAAAIPLVNKYSARLTKQLAAVYETPWPAKPVRVDVSEYANWAGAFTTTDSWGRVHEIVSSADPAIQGNTSLEILFHEATHGMVPDASGRLADAISRAAKASHVATPHDLVHIFIFYTAGEVTSRALADAGVKGYVPYADEKHLYRAEWATWHDKLQIYWRQHLDGTFGFEDAVNRIVTSGKAAR